MKEMIINNRQFRFYMVYQLFSGLGNGVFSFFMLLSIHLLYGVPMFTGIAAFLFGAPSFVAFTVGPVVDASNKVKIMRLTSLVEFIVLAVLAILAFTGEIPVFVMFAVILCFSVAALFERASKVAFLRQIVSENKLVEANAAINIASLIGGLGVAAAMFRMVAEDRVDFPLIFGLSMVFVALAFLVSLFLRDTNTYNATEAKSRTYFADLKAGAVFLRHSVLMFFLIGSIIRFFAMDIANVNLPAFVEYYWGARGYILLSVTAMIGSLFASVLVGRLGKNFRIGHLVFILMLLTGLVRITFAYILPTNFFGSQGIHIAYSAVGTAIGILSGAMYQKMTPKNMVARVNTLSTTLTSISAGLGALFGGWLGHMVYETGRLIMAHGFTYITIGIFLILVPRVRRLPKINELTEGE